MKRINLVSSLMKNLSDKKEFHKSKEVKIMIEKGLELPIETRRIIKDFCSLCYSMLELTGEYKCFLSADRKKSKIKTTAVCSFSKSNIRVYCHDRAIADILRSIGHEMFHLRQHEMDQVPVKLKAHHLSPIEWQANIGGGSLLSYYADKVGHDMIYQ